MRHATQPSQQAQILQPHPENNKPGNYKVTGDKHALAARSGVRCPRSPEPGQRA